MKTKTLLTLLCALLTLTGVVAFLRYALMMTFSAGLAASNDASGVLRDASGELAASGLAFGSVACVLAFWQLQRVFFRHSSTSRAVPRVVLPNVIRSHAELVS